MTTYDIRENYTYNSREIYFSGKPAETTRNALKALKMRWNGLKKCWYGFASESELINAIQSAEQENGGEGATVTTDGYMGGGAIYGSKSNKALYGADLAAAIRADIKAAGIKGVTVRCGKATYTDTIAATITIENADLKPDYLIPENILLRDLNRYGIWDGERTLHWRDLENDDHAICTNGEEFQTFRRKASAAQLSRYSEKNNDLNVYHLNAEHYPEFTNAFLAKCQAVLRIIKAYHYDESNSMVDYFNTNMYYDLYTKPGKTLKED